MIYKLIIIIHINILLFCIIMFDYTSIYLLVIDLNNLEEIKLYENKIKNLKKLNYNLVFFILLRQNIKIQEFDYIFTDKSECNFDSIIQYINNNKIYFDYFIYFKEFLNINFNKFFNFKSNNIYISDDNKCKIIPSKLINKFDHDYKKISITTEQFKLKPELFKSNFVDFNFDNPLVTIIMTAYNTESTIKLSIKSILNQKYTNFELIIIDDASTDNTAKIINDFALIDNRIKFYKTYKNMGCYICKNIGLKNMNYKSKYIAFQDSDDISLASRLYKQVNFMIMNKLLLSTVLFYENDTYKMPMISMVMERSIFENIGFFNNNRYGQDEDYYLRYFTLFETQFDWNVNITYNKNNGFFKDNYKYYKNLNEILYIVIRRKNSLTDIIKSRDKLSNYLIKKYERIFKEPFNIKKEKCYVEFENKYKYNEVIVNKRYYFKFPNEIKQAYVSKSLIHLQNRFLDKFNLVKFHTFSKPTIFFGMYNQEDIKYLSRVKHNKYIIWGGTDIDFSFEERKKNVNKILKIKIAKHYAISSNIKERLKKLNINNCKLINFSLVDKNIFYNNNNIKGDCIYIFDGLSNSDNDIYGKSIFTKVIEQLPEYKIIFSSKLNVSFSEMANIYNKCFIGLRLTKNDGNANTVQEMIEMGIPVIHNGDNNTILWKNENDIIENIKKCIPRYLIIFKKDMNLKDGSYTWILNFINLIKSISSICTIYVLCSKINSNLNIKNVIFIENNLKFDYTHIFYRVHDEIINFNDFSKCTLVIHKFNKLLIDYYKKFKYIIAQSLFIKDELKFNYLYSKINILPPLIKQIKKNVTKNNTLTFCYCGTLKKSYYSYEILNVFYNLSNNNNFIFNLIYGKIHEEDNEYDTKLNLLIKKLKKNENFNVRNDVDNNIFNELIEESHFGIVAHSKNIDFKQQSTKLIEYLSLSCIPIYNLSYLNSGYLDRNLSYSDIDEFENIIENILSNKIKYNDIKINYNKLNNHLIDNNLNVFNFSKKYYITKNIVENCSNILITNNFDNIFLNKNVLYINNNFEFNSENIKNMIENNESLDCNKEIVSNFNIKNINYKIRIKEYLFNFKDDYKYLKLYDIKIKDNYIKFNDNSGVLEIKLLLENDKKYLLDIDTKFIIDGSLFIMTILDNIDINRKLHFINSKNNKLKLLITPKETNIYTLKLKQSAKNTSNIEFIINNFSIKKIINLNNYCDKIKVINLDREIYKFKNVKQNFENNGIIVERCSAVDGNDENVNKLYKKYLEKKLTKSEINLGRKKIVSSGAIGYLLTMKKIFTECISNNYKYIMICDDDIGICNDFIIKFTELSKNVNTFRILMLGSSQWEWNNIDITKNYYVPDSYSNGSFCNIYHRNTFDNIYNKICNLSEPFDDIPMKSNFSNDYCYVSYPNLVIAQLETSNIREVNSGRNYDRFKWIKSDYEFCINSNKSYVKYKKENTRYNEKLFLIGVTTYNRVEYLRKCVNSLLLSLSDSIDYIIIFADGNSTDKTTEFIQNLDVGNNISIYQIVNEEKYIYRQTNSIFKFSEIFDYNFAFVINDDLEFLEKNWDLNYYKSYIESNYDHLVYFDRRFKKIDHYLVNNSLQSYCNAKNCMGALFTFTKKLINKVGYFDEENFKLRGHSHIDFTLRCCRLGFNNIDKLFDIKNSNKYIKLINEKYISTFVKIPFYLRELYKVDHYELLKRNLILSDDNRLYINNELTIDYKN